MNDDNVLTILVVERDGAFGRLFKEEFHEDFGAVVGSITEGHDLMKVIKVVDPDVIILGFRIPGYDEYGLDIVKETKDNFPDKKIIFWTSLHNRKYEALDYGADYFCMKSADLTELKNVIHEISVKNVFK
jgi:DNA-binding NarL/FixJ family response regulator